MYNKCNGLYPYLYYIFIRFSVPHKGEKNDGNIRDISKVNSNIFTLFAFQIKQMDYMIAYNSLGYNRIYSLNKISLK